MTKTTRNSIMKRAVGAACAFAMTVSMVPAAAFAAVGGAATPDQGAATVTSLPSYTELATGEASLSSVQTKILFTVADNTTQDALYAGLAALGIDASSVSLVADTLFDEDCMLELLYTGSEDGSAVCSKLMDAGLVANAFVAGSKTSTGTLTDEDVQAALASTSVNDPDFSKEWGLYSMKATHAWDTAKASSKVTVAVLDSGCSYTHEDLIDNLVPEQYAKNTVLGTTGAAAVDDTSVDKDDPSKPVSHGTHVAGIIAATSNNATGISGASYNANILPIKIQAEDPETHVSTGMPDEAIFGAMDYVVQVKTDPNSPDELKNIRVANMSFGGEYSSTEELNQYQAAIDKMTNAGILCVAAAGNDAKGGKGSGGTPVECNNVVGVSAMKQDTTGATPGVFDTDYSNYGPYIDLAAPGTQIYSTVMNNTYEMMDGTSMATPMVSGAAAALYSLNMSLTPSQMENILETTAVDLGTAGWDQYYGYGAIDMLAAAQKITSAATTTRLAGDNAYGTMTQIVNKGWASCETVVLATFDGYWDALSASGLAGVYDCPVLLTDANSLSSAASEQMTRLGAKNVMLAGGTAAVSDSVKAQLEQAGYTVTRLAGDNAVGTSVEIYNQGKGSWGDTCIIATVNGYYDALSASPYSYCKKSPIFLTNSDGTLDQTVLDAINQGGFKNAVIIGGTSVVSSSVEGQLTADGVANVSRKAGANCFETSTEFAQFCLDSGMTMNNASYATGLKGYWDALTGGALAGQLSSPLLLVDEGYENAITFTQEKRSVKDANIFGGTAVISDALKAKIDAAIA